MSLLVIAALLSSPCFPMFSQAAASISQNRKKECLREYFLSNINPKSCLPKKGFVGHINFGSAPYSIFEGQDAH